MLEFSKILNNKLGLNLETKDIVETIKNALCRYREQFEDTNVALENEDIASDIKITTDHEKLAQAIYKILSYAEATSPRAAKIITMKREDLVYEVTVLCKEFEIDRFSTVTKEDFLDQIDEKTLRHINCIELKLISACFLAQLIGPEGKNNKLKIEHANKDWQFTIFVEDKKGSPSGVEEPLDSLRIIIPEN